MRISNLRFVAVMWVGAVLCTSQAAVAQEPIEATYNRGVSLYRDGKITEAAEQFQRAAAAANPQLASKARFNLGNTHYARALQAIEKTQQPDQVAAIESLERAIASYRSALRIDPSDADARANIELASQLIKQLKQQQNQQQQQQNQDQQQQSQQDQNQQDQDQDQQQPSDQKQQNQQPSNDEQQDRNKEQQDQPQQDQQQPDQQQPDQQQQDQQQSDQQPQESQQDPTAEPQSSDQADSESSDRREPQQADSPEEELDSDEPKETPKGQLNAANEGDEEQRIMPPSVSPQEGQRMTEEEARKMLQAIRDRDMLRRLRRQAAERSRRIPVERDW